MRSISKLVAEGINKFISNYGNELKKLIVQLASTIFSLGKYPVRSLIGSLVPRL